MININELRRLAQAATPGPDGVSLSWITLLQDFQQAANPAVINELLDRLESAEADALEQSRLLGMGASREAALMARLEAAEKSDAESIAMYRKARDERDALRTRIEAAEKEIAHIKEVEFPRKARAVAVGWEMKCIRLEQERTIDEQRIADLMAELNRVGQENEELRARIDEMERQEPVAWRRRSDYEWSYKAKPVNGLVLEPLYLAPGAQGE